MPSLALKRRGVRSIVLRSMAINAFDPVGASEDQLRFLQAFMLLCLLHESPRIDTREVREIDANQGAAACKGRDPALKLQHRVQAHSLRQWAMDVCEAMQGICEA